MQVELFSWLQHLAAALSNGSFEQSFQVTLGSSGTPSSPPNFGTQLISGREVMK